MNLHDVIKEFKRSTAREEAVAYLTGRFKRWCMEYETKKCNIYLKNCTIREGAFVLDLDLGKVALPDVHISDLGTMVFDFQDVIIDWVVPYLKASLNDSEDYNYKAWQVIIPAWGKCIDVGNGCVHVFHYMIGYKE